MLVSFDNGVTKSIIDPITFPEKRPGQLQHYIDDHINNYPCLKADRNLLKIMSAVGL